MGKVECFVNMAEILVGCLGGSFTRVDINGEVKKNGKLQVLYWRLCLEGIFVFHVPVNWSYIVEIYPR